VHPLGVHEVYGHNHDLRNARVKQWHLQLREVPVTIAIVEWRSLRCGLGFPLPWPDPRDSLLHSGDNLVMARDFGRAERGCHRMESGTNSGVSTRMAPCSSGSLVHGQNSIRGPMMWWLRRPSARDSRLSRCSCSSGRPEHSRNKLHFAFMSTSDKKRHVNYKDLYVSVSLPVPIASARARSDSNWVEGAALPHANEAAGSLPAAPMGGDGWTQGSRARRDDRSIA
jgi:hypothetical protein